MIIQKADQFLQLGQLFSVMLDKEALTKFDKKKQ
jgi:hypothetical protein